jgi:ABC-type bacteriocin/lantibiotic exporter with double-glycine peptidase domain
MLTGIIVFIVAFIMNLLIGKASAKLQKEIMKRQDVRINATTESLNNIKMLKLYSLTDNFEKKIDDARENELMTLWKRLKLGIMSITGLYFFP